MQQFTLRACRINKGMRIEEAAKAIGRSVPAMYKWEKGETRISNEDFMKLCELYEIDPKLVKQF